MPVDQGILAATSPHAVCLGTIRSLPGGTYKANGCFVPLPSMETCQEHTLSGPKYMPTTAAGHCTLRPCSRPCSHKKMCLYSLYAGMKQLNQSQAGTTQQLLTAKSSPEIVTVAVNLQPHDCFTEWKIHTNGSNCAVIKQSSSIAYNQTTSSAKVLMLIVFITFHSNLPLIKLPLSQYRADA